MTTDRDWLADQFQIHRDHLHGVAHRLLGSSSEADDAVQDGWLRVSRAGTDGVANLGGWLTTVVARICLDRLRARTARREDAIAAAGAELAAGGGDHQREIEQVETVGLALLVVLDTLAPDERVVFVLHDLFGLAFDDIAPLIGRTVTASRALASRARRRVQGATPAAAPDRQRQREVVSAFLAASRRGDFAALLAVLHPDVVLTADPRLLPPGAPTVVRGVRPVMARATAFAARSQFSRLAVIAGEVGVVVAPRGRLAMVLRFTIVDGLIVGLAVIADPVQLAQLELAVVEPG